MYYLLSLKWSKREDLYVWWGPNDSGYTTDINQAGVYTEEQINSRKNYYSNTSTMPVPVELIEQSTKRIVVVALLENSNLFGIEDHLKTAIEY